MAETTSICALLPHVAVLVAEGALEDAFCASLAQHIDADVADVRAVYGALSSNLKPLIQSRDGWATLGKIMAPTIPFPVALASLH